MAGAHGDCFDQSLGASRPRQQIQNTRGKSSGCTRSATCMPARSSAANPSMPRGRPSEATMVPSAPINSTRSERYADIKSTVDGATRAAPVAGLSAGTNHHLPPPGRPINIGRRAAQTPGPPGARNGDSVCATPMPNDLPPTICETFTTTRSVLPQPPCAQTPRAEERARSGGGAFRASPFGVVVDGPEVEQVRGVTTCRSRTISVRGPSC